METPCSGALMEDIAVMRGDKLILRGLKFHGYHGVKPEERNLGQKFLVDVDAWLDLRQAGNSDCLSDTVSDTDIYRIVREVVEGPAQNLLESVAQLIASTTFTKHPQISAVRIKVGKPHVAVPGSVDYLGVEIMRFRRGNMERDLCQQDASHRDSSDRFCIICCNEVMPPFERDTISGHVYCAKHNFDRTLFCSACRTHRAGNKPFIDFDDGWKLCIDCHSIAIMDEKKLKPIIKNVQKFYRELNMRVDEDIPIFLVDRHMLHKHNPSYEGMTFDNSGEFLSVSRITYRAQPITFITSCSQGNKIIAKKETKQLTERPITAIMLLYGMPEVLTGECLTHHMMHAWLRLQRLDTHIKEGICAVMAYKWLNWLACTFDDSSYKSNEQVKIVRNFIEARIIRREQRPGLVGDRFRVVKEAVDKFGFQETLDYIANTESLPH